MRRMSEVMQGLAELAAEIPFQRAFDRKLPEIEELIAFGYTYKKVVEELAKAGYVPASGAVSVSHFAATLSRARAKLRKRSKSAAATIQAAPADTSFGVASRRPIGPAATVQPASAPDSGERPTIKDLKPEPGTPAWKPGGGSKK